MYTHTQHTFIAMYGARLEGQGAPSPLRARRRTDILLEATRRGAASSRTRRYVFENGYDSGLDMFSALCAGVAGTRLQVASLSSLWTSSWVDWSNDGTGDWFDTLG
jgi:hypothetical protein